MALSAPNNEVIKKEARNWRGKSGWRGPTSAMMLHASLNVEKTKSLFCIVASANMWRYRLSLFLFCFFNSRLISYRFVRRTRQVPHLWEGAILFQGKILNKESVSTPIGKLYIDKNGWERQLHVMRRRRLHFIEGKGPWGPTSFLAPLTSDRCHPSRVRVLSCYFILSLPTTPIIFIITSKSFDWK